MGSTRSTAITFVGQKKVLFRPRSCVCPSAVAPCESAGHGSMRFATSAGRGHEGDDGAEDAPLRAARRSRRPRRPRVSSSSHSAAARSRARGASGLADGSPRRLAGTAPANPLSGCLCLPELSRSSSSAVELCTCISAICQPSQSSSHRGRPHHHSTAARVTPRSEPPQPVGSDSGTTPTIGPTPSSPSSRARAPQRPSFGPSSPTSKKESVAKTVPTAHVDLPDLLVL